MFEAIFSVITDLRSLIVTSYNSDSHSNEDHSYLSFLLVLTLISAFVLLDIVLTLLPINAFPLQAFKAHLKSFKSVLLY
jgi:hypothetical protein